jgi:hypothetical protein
VPLHDLRDIAFPEAEIPGPSGVDDGIRAVLAQAEAVDGVYADVPDPASIAELVFECCADILRTALLTVAAFTHEHVGVVVPDLRARFRLRERREGAVRLRAFLSGLFRFLLGDDLSGL